MKIEKTKAQPRAIFYRKLVTFILKFQVREFEIEPSLIHHNEQVCNICRQSNWFIFIVVAVVSVFSSSY